MMAVIPTPLTNDGIASRFDQRDADNSVILHLAIENDDSEIMWILLKRRINVNVATHFGGTPLHYTVVKRNWEGFQLLLQHGANVNCRDDKGETPLHIAAGQCSCESIELLLKHGADVNCRDGEGKTPLHITAEQNSCEALELLLKHGADANARNKMQQTPLHLTMNQRCQSMARLLLQYGANVNAADINLRTPLHFATKSCDIHLFELLLSHRVNIDATDFLGHTPLHHAIYSAYTNYLPDHTLFVKKLLQLGAKVNFNKDECCSKPLFMAMRSKYDECIELLLTYGANPPKLDDKGRIFWESMVSEEKLQIVIKHLIHRAVAGFYVESFHEKCTKKINWDYEAYRQRCIDEIGKMKESTMCTDLTYYDFLHSNRRSLVGFVKMPEIVSIFEKQLLSTCFPIYANLLERNYAVGRLYEPVLESAIVALNAICKHRLPSEMLEQLLDYLDHMDMKNVIEAVPTLPKSSDCLIDN